MAFPVETADNLVAVEEEAIHQGATIALSAAQLQIGAAVNVQVAVQGFPLGSKDDDITNLVESLGRPPMPS
jgi:hypothetical protein